MERIPLRVAADHPAFDGHFPGQPLLPGVALLAEVIEALRSDPQRGQRFSGALGIPQVKFLAPVRPGAQLQLFVAPAARGVRFEVREGERLAASGQIDAAP